MQLVHRNPPLYLVMEGEPFPNPDFAQGFDPLAVTLELTPMMVQRAYDQGIFPWMEDRHGQCYWFSPEPRGVLFHQDLHLSRSFRRFVRRMDWHLSIDTDFSGVIRSCAAQPRSDQMGTWISPAFVHAYCALHEQGRAHSIEVRDAHSRLVGGLYGLCTGNVFCGESMFSRQSNASRLALSALSRLLEQAGSPLIDVQVLSDHLESLGAVSISRQSYRDVLRSHRNLADPLQPLAGTHLSSADLRRLLL